MARSLCHQIYRAERQDGERRIGAGQNLRGAGDRAIAAADHHHELARCAGRLDAARQIAMFVAEELRIDAGAFQQARHFARQAAPAEGAARGNR